MDILISIKELMKKSPGRTAREYSEKLKNLGYKRADKSTVNSLLYSNKRLFEFCLDNSNAPRWFLKGNEIITSESLSVSRSKPNKPKQITPKISLYVWQKEALNEWRAQNFQGVVEAVTGAGKTRVGIFAAIEEIERGGFVLVIVPSLELLRQWEKNIKDYLPDTRIGLCGAGLHSTFSNHDLIVSTVNAARKWDLLPPSKGGLLIADECHRYGSECNKDALDERFKRRLGLSATYQRNDNGNSDWLEPFFGDSCFELNYKRAIADGVISEFSIALVGVSFSNAERIKYDEHSEKLSKLRKKLTKNFDVTEEPFGEFMKEVTIMAAGGYEEGTIIARSYLSAFEKRRALLAESPAKMNGLLKLVDAVQSSNRSLIFTQTVDSAEHIAETLQSQEINAMAVHSRMKMDVRRKILSEFGQGRLKVVVAPQVLDEGIDVPEADFAIIIAASKTRRQMIQRMGRVLRRKRDGRRARFAILFVEDTSEDPKNGAHEQFIEDITGVATSVKLFDNRAPAETICRYLTTLSPQNF